MKRRLTAWLLLVSMLTLLIPAAGFAASTDVYVPDEENQGTISIIKDVRGLPDGQEPDTFVFEVLNEDGNVVDTVKVTADERYEGRLKVAPGNYTVREVSDFARVDGYTLLDTAYNYGTTDGDATSLEVVAGGLDRVYVTNSYEKETVVPPADEKVNVEIMVQKDISGKHEALSEKETFTFEIIAEDGKVIDTIQVVIENNDPIAGFKSVELDPNTTYYIRESKETLGSEKYPLDSTIFEIDGDHATNKIDFRVTPYTTSVEVTAINVYKEKDNGGTGLDFDVPEIFSEEHDAYISGYPDGTVQPPGNITRAEVAQILYRLLKTDVRNANKTGVNKFSDVPGDQWYNPAVSTMTAMGIISGYPDGTFRPNAPITRGELAALIDRFFDESLSSSSVSFNDINSHWARKNIISAASRGLVSGYPDGSFRPSNSITRAEAVSMINRITKRTPQTVADLKSGMVTFPDNKDTSMWYYLGMQEAANSHDYERRSTGYESWIKLR